MSPTKFVEKVKKIGVSVFFFPKIVPFYEIIWKNIVEPDGPQITI